MEIYDNRSKTIEMNLFNNFINISKTFLVKYISPTEKYIDKNNLTVKLINLNNVNDAEWFNDATQIETFKKFLEKKYIGFYCYKEDLCVHRLWLFNNSDRTYLNQEFIYKIKVNEMFVAWVETSEKYRKTGAFSKTINFVINSIQNKTFIASIDANNTKSINAFLKNGFGIYKKFLLLKFYKIKLSIQYKQDNKFCLKCKLGSIV